MLRIFLMTLIFTPNLLLAYDYDEYMPIAPRPTTATPYEINVPNTTDAPVNDIKPYEQTYDL